MVGIASGEANPEQLVQTQRAHLYQELHDATTKRDSYDPQSELAQIMLTDKTIMHLEADLRWLDMIEMRLDAIKGQPFPEPTIRRRGRPKKSNSGTEHPPPKAAVNVPSGAVTWTAGP